MKLTTIHLGRLAAVGAVAGLTVGFAGHAAQAMTWKELVAAAEKEGEVTVAVHHGVTNRIARTKGWKEAFPKIKMNVINTGNQQIIPRMMREAKAGIYTIDAIFGGFNNHINIFKPAGMLLPLRDAIVDKTILEDKNWRGGFAAGFGDTEKKYTYAYERTAVSQGYINWEFVDKNDIKSMDDILKPKFNGKLVWHDPRRPGVGYAFMVGAYYGAGEDWLRKVWKMDAVYSRNRRQVTEWMVRGRYPIAFGVNDAYVELFTKQGLCKQCKPIPLDWYKQRIAFSGSGNIVHLNHAPHPNAAKLYINWFLQQKQQQQWTDVTQRSSRRLDVKNRKPSTEPKAGVKSIEIFDEDHLPTAQRMIKLAKQLITKKAVGGKKRRKK